MVRVQTGAAGLCSTVEGNAGGAEQEEREKEEDKEEDKEKDKEKETGKEKGKETMRTETGD